MSTTAPQEPLQMDRLYSSYKTTVYTCRICSARRQTKAAIETHINILHDNLGTRKFLKEEEAAKK